MSISIRYAGCRSGRVSAIGYRAGISSSLFPDCELGAMPPFGSLYNLAVYVDESLAADDAIVFNAGTHRDAIRMRYDDFVRLAKPRVCSFAQKG